MKENQEEIKTNPEFIFEEAISLAHAAVTNAMSIHETMNHDGEICWDERKNLIAYLFVNLGLESKDVKSFKDHVAHHELQQTEDEDDEEDLEDNILNAKNLTLN